MSAELAGRLQERRDPLHADVIGHALNTCGDVAAGSPHGRVLKVRAGRGPDPALDRPGDREAAGHQLIEPDLTRVTLGHGIRRDHTEVAATGQE